MDDEVTSHIIVEVDIESFMGTESKLVFLSRSLARVGGTVKGTSKRNEKGIEKCMLISEYQIDCTKIEV